MCNTCVNISIVSTKPGRPERFCRCPERFCPDSLSDRAASDCSLVPSVGIDRCVTHVSIRLEYPLNLDVLNNVKYINNLGLGHVALTDTSSHHHCLQYLQENNLEVNIWHSDRCFSMLCST